MEEEKQQNPRKRNEHSKIKAQNQVGEKVNESRGAIAKLKGQIEQLRVERAMRYGNRQTPES